MLSDNLKKIDAKGATIVCASKYVDSSKIREMYNLGVSNMGENRVQAFLEKYDELKDLNIIWHFIGHLQTNKVKDVINKITYLHSLDSIKLAKEIEKYATKKIKCFIEINDGEEQKTGISLDEAINFYNELKSYSKIEVVGFMSMAPNTVDEALIEEAFLRVKNLKDKIDPNLYLSMGMSNDYKIALKCGATHIRLGSILWKE